MKAWINIWGMTKTRNEKHGVAAVLLLSVLLHVSLAAPFVIAYMAGAEPLVLVSVAAGIYGLRKAESSLASFVGEIIGKRRAQENEAKIETAFRELFAKAREQRGGSHASVLDLPRGEKKAGGLN